MSYFTQLWEGTVAYFSSPELLGNFVWTTVRIILIYVAARVIIRVAGTAMTHMMSVRQRSPLKFDTRRTNTIGRLVRNIISYTVNFISILLILGQVGVNLGPLLAGAGVLGLAIGFGAQSLVKDVITGFFIIFEDQFGVGDVIQIDQFKGRVEEIGIRVTRIKSWTGEVHIIPNGSIVKVTNFSTYNSLAVLDVPIPYATDVDKAIKLLKHTVSRVFEMNENVVKEPEVLGVQTLTNTEMKLRVVAECLPNTQSEIERVINAEVKKSMDQLALDRA